MGDEKSLAHTRWNCKYHIVFAPKYRRQAFYGEKRRAVGSILRKLCEWKNVRTLEAECCADHIHMLLEIPPKMSVSSFMGYLKGKSSLMLYEQFGDLKFKYRNREFWCRGYYVDTVGKNTATQGTSLKRIKWESSYQSLIRAARLRAVSNEF
ncbi:transposase for IS200 [Salmonella enterica subsp. enterica serovar Daytona]|uniref:Transposase for IS200 n=1 Tax=Salmonella enterica subsp. enterica serovar Daytona TaxID=1962639 RepID=A0A447JI42_SALET|nr:transposase for IS200 [Salmonella enterica subsp. enterica serovar Daytona]